METVKIKKVDVHNLKAVSNFTAFFDGNLQIALNVPIVVIISQNDYIKNVK